MMKRVQTFSVLAVLNDARYISTQVDAMAGDDLRTRLTKLMYDWRKREAHYGNFIVRVFVSSTGYIEEFVLREGELHAVSVEVK
jgi:hypothetical protein